jgi:hypothetical protein
LCWLLEGRASDFYSHIVQRDPDIEYFDLISKFKRRFDFKDVTETLILEFQNAKQKSDESLVEWGQRVVDLAMDAYHDMPDERMYSMAVRRFCQGVYDKEAAQYAANFRPATIDIAIRTVRNFQHNRNMIFGKQKSVRFEDRYHTEIRSTTPEYDFETGDDEEGYQVQSINTKSPSQKPKETMVQKQKEGLVKNNRVAPSPRTMEDRMLVMEGKLDLLTENLANLLTMQGRRQGTSPYLPLPLVLAGRQGDNVLNVRRRDIIKQMS